LIVENQCEAKEDSTIEWSIDNWFDCLFKQSRNANVKKIIKLSKIFQFDKNLTLLFKNRDNSSNQRNCVQSRTEENRALDEKNRIRFEAYQES
jgi:hypothetical protein